MTTRLELLQQMLEHATASNVPHVNVMKRTVENSSWHREANVWVHTQSVVGEFVKIWKASAPEDDRSAFLTGIACLFHDFGKPDAEQTLTNKDGVAYRRYAGHEAISASEFRLFATDPILWNQLFGVDLDLEPEEVFVIALMIQHHLPYQYKKDMVHSIFDTVNCFLSSGSDLFFNMLRADARGRISDDHEAKLQAVEDWIAEVSEDYEQCVFYRSPEQKYAYVIIGPSGSGKSTWVSQWLVDADAVNLNMDSIRLELYGDRNITDPGARYTAAFTKSCENKNEFNGVVQQRASELLRSDAKIVMSDNMNLSKKARRSFISMAKQCNRKVVGVVFCSVSLSELQRRASTRGDRQIPASRIEDMFKSLYLPALDEFDTLTIL